MKLPLLVAAAAVLIGAAPNTARALSIVPVFDSSVTSLRNASTIEAAFTAVARAFDASFATPVTVKIGVSWGKVDGVSLGSGNIAASRSPLTGPFSYSDVTAIFAGDAAANPTNMTMAIAAAKLASRSPAGSLPYEIPYAEAQALGYLPAAMKPDSGYVGFSTSAVWDFSKHNGITAGTYDFQALAAHEISEVLGRITGLDTRRPTYATPLDALRYSAPGQPSFSYGAPAYFSIDGGRTNLGAFNVAGGGDRSDWSGISGDAQNAYLRTGVGYALMSSDLKLLDVLGWGAVTPLPAGTIAAIAVTAPGAAMGVPEPGTWGLMLAGLGVVGAFARLGRAAGARTRGTIPGSLASPSA